MLFAFAPRTAHSLGRDAAPSGWPHRNVSTRADRIPSAAPLALAAHWDRVSRHAGDRPGIDLELLATMDDQELTAELPLGLCTGRCCQRTQQWPHVGSPSSGANGLCEPLAVMTRCSSTKDANQPRFASADFHSNSRPAQKPASWPITVTSRTGTVAIIRRVAHMEPAQINRAWFHPRNKFLRVIFGPARLRPSTKTSQK
jgi:hypothetical protein